MSRANAADQRRNADANLLFGGLAWQMDFITREQLIAGMHAWVHVASLASATCFAASTSPGNAPPADGLSRCPAVA